MSRKDFAVWTLLVVLFGCSVGAFARGIKPKHQVAFVTDNPYSYDIGIELKCDWKGSITKWLVHRRFLLKAKSRTTWRVPVQARKCQIWTRVGRLP